MKLVQDVFFVLVTSLSLAACSSDQVTSSSRKDKFLSLFSIVRFKNSPCSGIEGLTGVCYPFFSCLKNSGSYGGVCGGGAGTCCVTKLGCGASTSNNCTYVESQSYPGTFNSAMTCVQTINLNSDTCQVRLDVVEVRLAAPDNTGKCNNDVLTFSQDTKWSQVCGLTQNTHFYLDVDPATNSQLDFTFTTDGTSFDRRWRIKVSQIPCDCSYLAPCGCGQYFTGVTGNIVGWNAHGSPDYYLSGQNYAMCIRREVGYCQNRYVDASTDRRFIPRCGDTLEFPFAWNSLASGELCDSFVPPTANAIVMEYTADMRSPHYMYLVTTSDENNVHLQDSGATAGNMNMMYTMIACP